MPVAHDELVLRQDHDIRDFNGTSSTGPPPRGRS